MFVYSSKQEYQEKFNSSRMYSLFLPILQHLCYYLDKDTPWCFYPDGGQTGDCSNYNWVAEGPGFTDEFYATMKANYRANLNVEEVSPDWSDI